MKFKLNMTGQWIGVLNQYLFNPDPKLIRAGNLVFFSVCLTCGVAIGSAVSVYVIAGIIFSTYHIMRGAYKVSENNSIKIVGLAFFVYFCTTVLTALINTDPNWATAILSDSIFLGFVPLVSLVKVDKNDLLAKIEISSAIVSVLIAPIAIWMVYVGYSRIELAAGNPGITAVLASILLLVNLIAINRTNNNNGFLFIFGAIASCLLILLTGMRSMFPLILILPLITFLLFRSRHRIWMGWKRFLLVLALLFGVSILAYPLVSSRFISGLLDFEQISSGSRVGSIGSRLELWRAGWLLFLESPVFGHGPGQVMHVLKQKTAEISPQMLDFTHFHNAILNELVRTGIVGFIALIIMFFIPFREVLIHDKNDMSRNSLALLTGVYIIYFQSGLTGIMLHHDLTDSIFLTTIVVSVYLSCVTSEESSVLKAGSEMV